MNPFGFLSVLSVAVDAIGQIFGRKPKKPTRRQTIWAGVFYVLFLVLGVAVVVVVVHQIYFGK